MREQLPMKVRLSGLLVFAASLLPRYTFAADGPAAIAYTDGYSVKLADTAGKTIRTIHLPRKPKQLNVSPDMTRAVVVFPAGTYGGPLYLLTFSTGKVERLTQGRYYFKRLEKGEAEVYDDPEFSPDGKSIAFAVHTETPGDANDGVMASGPIAVMEVATRKVLILKSTTNVNGGGVAFSNSPHWSADGKWILVNFEVGAAITNSAGTSFKDLTDAMSGDGSSWNNAIDWLGMKCVLYVAGPDGANADSLPPRWLHMDTLKTESAAQGLNIREEKLAGLIQIRNGLLLRRVSNRWIVDAPKGSWQSPVGAFVQLLGRADTKSVPASCK